MIVVGGLTRLTDSGLSITEWQLFSGFLPPLNNIDWINYFDLYKKIPEFTEQNYSMTMQEFIDVEHKEGSKATFLHGLFGKRLSIFFLLSCMAINSYVTEIINLVSTISPIVQQPAEIVLGESIAVSKKYKNDLFA